jgi:hypothetical protein
MCDNKNQGGLIHPPGIPYLFPFLKIKRNIPKKTIPPITMVKRISGVINSTAFMGGGG